MAAKTNVLFLSGKRQYLTRHFNENMHEKGNKAYLVLAQIARVYTRIQQFFLN